MAKKKVRLTHCCNHADCKGGPGDVVECDEQLAQRFIDGRGAVAVDDTVKATASTEKKTEKK